LKQRILDTLTVIAEAYEGQVYQFLEKAKIRAQDFASDGFIRTQLQKAVRGNTSAFSKLNKHLIKNKIVLDKTINAVCILSLEGRVVASTDKAKIGKELSKEDCFVKGQKSTAITESLNEHMGLPEIRISTPIFAKETGRPIGVLVNCILISELNKLLVGEYVKELGAVSWGKGSGAWKTLEMYLVNRDKLMITKSIFVEDAILKQIVDTLPVNLCLTSSEEMAGFYKDYRGVEVVGASMYIPSMKWVLLIEIDKDEVLAPVRYVLINALITAVVVIVMIVLLFIGFIKKTVTPLRKISEAAKKIASGNFDVVVPVQTHDEIGVLCESFNYMTDHIKARTTALTRSEARLAEAQRIAHIGNWEWDIVGNELYWSDEIYRIFGLLPQEFGATYEAFLNCVHPDDREFVKKSVNEALNDKKSYDIDHRILLKDTTIRIVHEKAVVIYDDTGMAARMVGTVQDITKQKRSSEEIYLLQTMTLAISASKDLHDAFVITIQKVCNFSGWVYGEAWKPNPDGTLLERDHAYWSSIEGFEKFSAFSEGMTFPSGIGLPGRSWLMKQPIWVQDVTLDPNYLRAPIAREVGLKTGIAFPVIADNEVVAVIVFYHVKAEEENERLIKLVLAVLSQIGSIIKRKRTEEALRESEERLRAILDNTTAVVYIKDIQGRYTFINRQFENLFHIKMDEIKGKTPYDCFPKEIAASHIENDQKVFESKIPMQFDEMATHDDGIHLYLSVKFPLFDPDGTAYAVCGISTDITERKQIEEAKTRLSEITETTTDFVGTATIDGRILYINKAGRKVIGIGENEDISNLRISDCHPKWARELILTEGIPDAIREGAWIGETAFLSRDSREIPISQVIIAHKNPDGTVRNLSTIGRDISERKRFEEQMTYMANRDPLTKLFNRRRFYEDMEGWLAQTRRFGIKGAVLFLDIDNFKYINDSLGHQAGDKLLIAIADLLRERLRETDILARLGGDEFAIILPHADVVLAESVANQIRELVQYHTSVEGNYPPGISVSIGIAMFPGHGDTVETLLAYADLAMYRAKEEGRNRVCIYTPEQKTQIESRLIWEKLIREALDQDRFVLFLQPIMDIRQNLIIGHEALLRMINEKSEMVAPSSFIDIAERFGLIHDIDRWVVSRAIRLIQKLKQDNKPAYLEVNLSGRSFADKKLLPLIRNELAETGIDPASLVFEITETALIENMAAAQLFIAELKSLGCRFALDDFGVGFSSFNYIKHLPVDYLKIDGSFVRNLPHDTVDQHLVKAMVEVARGLGKKTTAEFVENEATLRLLREYGVDYAQGYHIGKPRHVSEL